MPAPSLLSCNFHVRYDDVSVQVSCDQEPKFWFRLELADDLDIITDFTVGAFDQALGGDLLAMCFSKIGRTPHTRLVFRDILSCRPGDPATVANAKLRFEEYAGAMLANYDRYISSSHIATRLDKFDLVIASTHDLFKTAR
jgi:hypothetical protein